ncbi:MAG: hypothetical protein H7A25_14710 [Leptospiraceae bacterium]|nr:hypothetical protein [Leptospiraceae bacterium]MCP5501152.1 hypothetical protein [Leptospiraceae bacterium]
MKLLLSILFLFPFFVFSAEDWDLSYYRGKFSDTNLGEILLQGKTKYREDYVNILALNVPIHRRLWNTSLEAEGQMGWHSGIQKHMEFNTALLARFDGAGTSALSFAVGEGLSLATFNPDLENPRKSFFSPYTESEYSNKLLNFLIFELQVSAPSLFKLNVPSPFVRIHHRSGIYGVFCPPTCGSNYISYGFRWKLNSL